MQSLAIDIVFSNFNFEAIVLRRPSRCTVGMIPPLGTTVPGTVHTVVPYIQALLLLVCEITEKRGIHENPNLKHFIRSCQPRVLKEKKSGSLESE